MEFIELEEQRFNVRPYTIFTNCPQPVTPDLSSPKESFFVRKNRNIDER